MRGQAAGDIGALKVFGAAALGAGKGGFAVDPVADDLLAKPLEHINGALVGGIDVLEAELHIVHKVQHGQVHGVELKAGQRHTIALVVIFADQLERIGQQQEIVVDLQNQRLRGKDFRHIAPEQVFREGDKSDLPLEKTLRIALHQQRLQGCGRLRVAGRGAAGNGCVAVEDLIGPNLCVGVVYGLLYNTMHGNSPSCHEIKKMLQGLLEVAGAMKDQRPLIYYIVIPPAQIKPAGQGKEKLPGKAGTRGAPAR